MAECGVRVQPRAAEVPVVRGSNPRGPTRFSHSSTYSPQAKISTYCRVYNTSLGPDGGTSEGLELVCTRGEKTPPAGSHSSSISPARVLHRSSLSSFIISLSESFGLVTPQGLWSSYFPQIVEGSSSSYLPRVFKVS